MLKRAWALLFVGAMACSGSDTEDGGVMFDLPQIVPDNTPVCLSFERVVAGQMRSQNVLLRNDGREQLLIESATITDDLRGVFELVGVEPKAVNTRDSAVVRFHYRPTMEGWDSALLRVRSNAQNFPDLRIFILALAEPENLNGDPWEPGPKPDSAGTGEDEACRTDQ